MSRRIGILKRMLSIMGRYQISSIPEFVRKGNSRAVSLSLSLEDQIAKSREELMTGNYTVRKVGTAKRSGLKKA